MNSFVNKILSVILAAALLSVTALSGDTGGSNTDKNYSGKELISLYAPDIGTLPLLLNEELRPSDCTHITALHTLKKLSQTRSLLTYPHGSPLLKFFVSLLYTVILMLAESITYSRRYTIKYIHDKDGHKLTAPIHSDNNERRFYNESCAYSFMCFNNDRNART